MADVLIIADDLSGAADCAASFFKAGLETLVVIDGRAEQEAGTAAARVLAIDADTRRLPGAEAARIQLDLYKRHRSAEQLLYKKMDSTLRGNFAQELGSLIAEAGLAIVAPAFPPAGRITTHGHQYLDATPLEMTAIWREEGMSGKAHIPSMLARHGIRAASLPIADIRQGAQHLRAALETCARDGVQAAVCDAETDADLQAIAQASISLPLPRFWVGSAGLAKHLPLALPAEAKPLPLVPVQTAGSILTLVGSMSGASRAQADCLSVAARMERIEVPASVLRLGQSHPHWRELRNALQTSLQNSRDLLLLIGMEPAVDRNEGLQLCQALALLVAPLAARIGAVIATGGETARAILTAMGANGLRLVGEIEAGVPLSIAIGAKPIPVITKAGAFGTRETLLRCYEVLRQTRAGSAGAATAAPADIKFSSLH